MLLRLDFKIYFIRLLILVELFVSTVIFDKEGDVIDLSAASSKSITLRHILHAKSHEEWWSLWTNLYHIQTEQGIVELLIKWNSVKDEELAWCEEFVL